MQTTLLIMGQSAVWVAEFAAVVGGAGEPYAMDLLLSKAQALSICTDERVLRPGGTVIDETGAVEYLGSLLSADGRTD